MSDGDRVTEATRPILVGGCPRSGTTMLQLMLHAHPRIAIPPETRFVLEGYRRRRAFLPLSSAENRRRLAGWIVDRPDSRFVDLRLDPKRVGADIEAAPTLGSAFQAVFRAYAERFGKVRWGDKRPAYIANLPVLLRLFPDAQIVHIVRDGRDCVASLKEMSWHHTGLHRAISTWAQAVDHGDWAAQVLGPDTYHELRYEDLVTDTEKELRRLCQFLGEEYDPAMAEPAAMADVAVPAHKTWHARTRLPVGSDRVGRWQRRLDPAEAALCEAALGSRLRAHGYELAGLAPPQRSQRMRYELATARQRFAPIRRVAVRTLDRLPGTTPVAAE
jgi:Sulfotransferase family